MRILPICFIGATLLTLAGCTPGTYSFYPHGDNPNAQPCCETNKQSCNYLNYDPKTVQRYYPVVGF